jgi:uncharacterized phage protein (TIGR01671 family)
MSRELKFRIFDKDVKRFLTEEDVKDFELFLTTNGEVYSQKFGTIHTSYKALQYTGLKDKNGVEIYEGDVIESFYSGKYPEPIEVHVVKAETRCGGFSPFVDKYDTEWYAGEFEQPNIEVIGNIFENPELIKQ